MFSRGPNDLRWRIEHAQVVSEEDVARFGDYSVIPSVQPTHATSDMYWAGERLGRNRIRRAYAYQELLQALGMTALGTDFPVEDIDPRKTFAAAVARTDAEGYPVGGFQLENALTREQALRGMTQWVALAQFQENDLGTIEIGKWRTLLGWIGIGLKSTRNPRVPHVYMERASPASGVSWNRIVHEEYHASLPVNVVVGGFCFGGGHRHCRIDPGKEPSRDPAP